MSEIAPRPRAPSARTPAGLTSKPRRSPRAAATPAADKQRPTAAAQSEPLPRERAEHLARALAPWFLAHQRDLEWRHTRDPYAIRVSEVMLQQTRVDTVKSYWAPFMRRFPDLATLAAADEQQVLAAWSGLGYYRRARLLHAGARHVADSLGGALPADPAALREIPGIGRYTAGAIASIAHDRPAALVDGNVARVLSRLQAIGDPKQQDASAVGHWSAAQQIVEAGSPRILGQALMELGATVCTPHNPRRRLPRPQRVPRRPPRPAPTRSPRRSSAPPRRSRTCGPSACAAPAPCCCIDVRARACSPCCGACRIERPPAAPEAPHGSLFDRARVTPAAVRKLTGVEVKRMEPLREPIKHVFTHRVWLLWPCRGEATITDDPPPAPGGTPCGSPPASARLG